MRIQHNIMAMNAYRNYSHNTSALSKNREKLSSGYRINRAGDDAAGLAISEKMRAQITGLEAAQKNVKDGISLVNTAEGALQEVQDMMNRMVYLAQESANGTFDNEVDRKSLQDEIDQLKEEINRIADSANFNGIKLLDGSLESGSATAGAGSVKGEMVATVESDIASLKTNVKGDAAVKGIYEVTVAAAMGSTGDGAKAPATSDVLKFTVDYVDADGVARSKTVYAEGVTTADTTAAAIGTLITNAINADEDLKKLFDAAAASTTTTDIVQLKAKEAGTNGAQLTGLNIVGFFDANDRDDNKMNTADPSAAAPGSGIFLIGMGEQKVTVHTAAVDESTENIIDFGTNSIAAGNTITVGDKTYEFVASGGDVFSVAEGNIAVVAGNDTATSISNLTEALKANGVTTAVADTTKIKIGDLDQIKAANSNVEITTSNKDGIKINTVKADKAKSEFTVMAGSGKKATFEIKYIDENGEEKTASLSYESDSATASSNALAIIDAFNKHEELSNLFTIAQDNTNKGLVAITAKTDGAAGAKVTSVKTTDQDPDSVRALRMVKDGRGAGQTIALDVDKMNDGDTLTIDGTTFQFVDKDNLDSVKDGNTAVILDKTSQNVTAANLNLALKQKGMDSVKYNGSTNSFFIAKGETAKASNGGLTLQIGDTSDSYNQLTVNVKDMHTKAMGLDGIDISNQAGAQAAVDVIKDAINYVSSVRGTLGAISNRLDHTSNNLSVMRENIQDAESSIRDTDVADEMMAYTKNNILVQSAQAMLAQANQVPQGVLQLLQ